MDLSDLLTAGAIMPRVKATTKKQALVDLAAQAAQLTGRGANEILETLLQREKLGSTGVGKSTSVSLLLNEILLARPNLRVFLLDVHNEYGRCFGSRALVLNPLITSGTLLERALDEVIEQNKALMPAFHA